jgi:hypothetical protein
LERLVFLRSPQKPGALAMEWGYFKGMQMPDAENPLEMIYYAILETKVDWMTDEASAVIFAVTCGWHEVAAEVVEKFGWSDEKILRLEGLRREFISRCPVAMDD